MIQKKRSQKHKKHHIKDYSISQNFLTSRRLLERIVNLSSIDKDDAVLEIGSGKGHLTVALSKKCKSLISIEIDKELYECALAKVSGEKNVRLIQGDFLKYKLPRHLQYKVFANIPYSITTRIVDKLTKAINPPKEMWLVLAKNAAMRFLGLNHESARSRKLNQVWDMKIMYYFKREDFHPKPSVDSVLMHFSRKTRS